MAYAAYRDSFRSYGHPPQQTPRPVPVAVAPRPVTTAWMVMAVTVPMLDAHTVRRAIAGCRGCGVLRCTPDLREHCVQLDVQLPQSMHGVLMHSVIGCVPAGEFGRLVSWSRHVAAHRLDHRVRHVP